MVVILVVEEDVGQRRSEGYGAIECIGVVVKMRVVIVMMVVE